MTPTRVERHLEIWVGLSCGLDDEIGSLVEPRKIDAKMRQPIFKSNRQ